MQKHPVLLCYGKYPLARWERVNTRFKAALRDKLQETMEQDSSLPHLVRTIIKREICISEDYGCTSCFSVEIKVELARLEASSYKQLSEIGVDQVYLDKFPPPAVWYFCTLMHEPICT